MVFCVAEEVDYSCARIGRLAALAESRWADSLCNRIFILISVLSQYCLADLIVCCVATCSIYYVRLLFICQVLIMSIMIIPFAFTM